jgi:ribosome maturation factor RimP
MMKDVLKDWVGKMVVVWTTVTTVGQARGHMSAVGILKAVAEDHVVVQHEDTQLVLIAISHIVAVQPQ